MDQLKIIGLDIGRFGNMSHKKPYMKIIMIFAIRHTLRNSISLLNTTLKGAKKRRQETLKY